MIGPKSDPDFSALFSKYASGTSFRRRLLQEQIHSAALHRCQQWEHTMPRATDSRYGVRHCCLHLEMYSVSRLQIFDDLDKIVSLRVAGRPKHTHETLWINIDSLSQCAETNGRIDVITQNCFSGFCVT